MKQYSLQSCETLIDRYVNQYKGKCTVLEEGCLGLGTMLLHSAEGKKMILIREIFLNAWSSTHTIRMYNKMPKKYESRLT